MSTEQRDKDLTERRAERRPNSCNPDTEFTLGWDAGHAAIDSADPERLRAVRMIHQKEQFGDCVEDGERFPCKTIQVLDWVPDEKEMD